MIFCICMYSPFHVPWRGVCITVSFWYSICCSYQILDLSVCLSPPPLPFPVLSSNILFKELAKGGGTSHGSSFGHVLSILIVRVLVIVFLSLRMRSLFPVSLDRASEDQFLLLERRVSHLNLRNYSRALVRKHGRCLHFRNGLRFLGVRTAVPVRGV